MSAKATKPLDETLLEGRTLSTANAAIFLDCSTDHVARLIADGELGYINIGRGRPKIRIPLKVLQRYVKKNLQYGALDLAGGQR